jgi:phospholipid-binding lipoprotein MlaA
VLQGDVRNFATELGRFLLNTTAGLAGFLDVATDVGLVQDEEDLGQTLGRYGVGHGFYVVVPFMGSSSLRDVIGNAGTAAINPVYQNLDTGEIVAINLTDAELALSLDQDTYESLYDSSLDPYAFFRSAWTQNRAGRVAE